MDRMRTLARLGARCLVALVGLVLIQVLVRPGGSGSGLAGGPAPAGPTAAPAPRVAAVPARAVARAASADRLAWFAGCWEGMLSSGAAYEESWLAPRGGTLIGMARMTRDGRTLSYEFMRIAEEDGTLVYSAQPSGRPPTHFRAAEVGANEVVFENPDHDFPQRILYRHTPPDRLDARIEGERDGRTRGFDFPLRRVACTAGAAVPDAAARPEPVADRAGVVEPDTRVSAR